MNLRETLLSAQTSEPEWLGYGATFTDVEVLDGTPVKYSLGQLGDADSFFINIDVVCSRINEEIVRQLKSHVARVLGLQDDLADFYQTYSDEQEPLSSTFSRLRGLRLMRATSLYESLIFSILSQNNSARRMNGIARLLMQCYGPRAEFPDGSTYFLFPKPEALANATPSELRARTSMGYRAKPVVEVSRLITRGDLRLEELGACSYDEAMSTLLDLPGVGPKVADCFLLYGVGLWEAAPVDVWIHRIVSHLYFKRRKITRLKTAEFLRGRFGAWAGYAQLYLFDYARRGILVDGKKWGLGKR